MSMQHVAGSRRRKQRRLQAISKPWQQLALQQQQAAASPLTSTGSSWSSRTWHLHKLSQHTRLEILVLQLCQLWQQQELLACSGPIPSQHCHQEVEHSSHQATQQQCSQEHSSKAARILPMMSAAFSIMLLCFLGLFGVLLELPGDSYLASLLEALLEWANETITYYPPAAATATKPPDEHSQLQQDKTSKRKQCNRQRSKPDAAQQSQQQQEPIRCTNWLACFARLVLGILLISSFSCVSVSAMQVSSNFAAPFQHDSRGVPQPLYLYPFSELNSRTSLLLQHELTQLPDQCFALSSSTDDNQPSTQWYKPDPSVLDELSPEGQAEMPHDAAWTIHPEGKWILGNHPEATPEQLDRLVAMLQEQKAAFAYSLDDLPGYDKPPISFQLVDPSKRAWVPPRNCTEQELEFGDSKVQEMVDSGIVREIPATNQHAARITLPMKRAPDDSWTDRQFCIDLRNHNSNNVVDKYGMPLPEELFRRLRGAKYLTKLDLKSGFWQIRLSPEAQQQVAFWWRNRLYTYTCLPFGHVNATAIFQRAIETEIQNSGVVNSSLICYREQAIHRPVAFLNCLGFC